MKSSQLSLPGLRLKDCLLAGALAMATVTWTLPVQVWAQATAQLSLEKIYSDIERINQSIEATKQKMNTVKDARFLPDLYFVLGELHVEKSRFMYAAKRLQNKNVPANEIDFTNEKRPKLQAIEIYKNIMEKFPTLDDRDKALFFMAHEYRELGQLDDMAKTYQRLTREFPTSPYWAESQLIIGNYFFEEKKDLETALEIFRKIVAKPPGPFTSIAYYKLGWIYINQNKFKEALISFESVLDPGKQGDVESLPDIYKKTDVRRDAIVAMVWPYSEIRPNELDSLPPARPRSDPLKYFLGLSNNLVTYQKALRSLGRRLGVKQRYVLATRVHFELLRFSNDLESRREAIEKTYESMKNTQNRWPVNFFVQEIAKTLNRVKTSPELSQKEKDKDNANYEVFARDVATRFQERAAATKNENDYKLAIHAYLDYLNTWPESKFSDAVRQNIAESNFALKRYVEAGKWYESLASIKRLGAKRKAYADSALQAYITALKTPAKWTKLELLESRNGMRDVGNLFIKDWPSDKAIPFIRFNIGRTFYDERNFDGAVKAFQAYIKAFPNHSEVRLASDLILDSFNQKEDYAGLVKAGKWILADNRISAEIRKDVGEIVKQAEYKKIQAKAGDYSSPDYTKNLLKFAKQYKGSQIGDQALYEAFISLKAKRDPGAYDPGEQLLIQHENSKYAKEVVTAMGQMSMVTADFRRASRYFEAYAKKYPSDKESSALMKNAATMREYMGDFSEAKEDFRNLRDAHSMARMDFLASKWDQLAASAAGAGGIHGAYWGGLARYRSGDIKGATPLLTRAASMGGGGYQENTMAAHALYLLSSEALKNYASVQMEAGREAQAIQTKTKMLEKLTAQLNKVIKFGNGRWTIAAMYGLGQAQREFAEFVSRAPIPAGLPPAAVQQYKAAIAQQASNYQKAAKKIFADCVANAEKFDVYSSFVQGCQSEGQNQVNEAQETKIIAKASDSSPAAAQGIRNKLYDKPRDVRLLTELAKTYAAAQDYSMSTLILGRALEIEPQNMTLVGLQGINALHMNDLESAYGYFQKALKAKPNEGTALWGLAGMAKEFKYSKKLQALLPKARRSPQPDWPLHAWIRSAQ